MYKSLIQIFIPIIFSCNEKINKSINEDGILNEDAKYQTILNKEKNTINTRFNTPERFERTKYPENSFETYLRTFSLKPDGNGVYYYNGVKKNKNYHAAVLDIDVGSRDLQQCADAIMRLRAEYLYINKRYDDIHFKFVNGFNCEYKKWAEGNRVKFNGNKSTWQKAASVDYSYETFRKYMDIVFSYAGTLSLEKELNSKDYKDIKIGDIFIQGGSPGHAIIVMDEAVDPINNKKIYMLAQSYMPAQDIHILVNLKNKDISPWYEVNLNLSKIETPEWDFYTSDLTHF